MPCQVSSKGLWVDRCVCLRLYGVLLIVQSQLGPCRALPRRTALGGHVQSKSARGHICPSIPGNDFEAHTRWRGGRPGKVIPPITGKAEELARQSVATTPRPLAMTSGVSKFLLVATCRRIAPGKSYLKDPSTCGIDKVQIAQGMPRIWLWRAPNTRVNPHPRSRD